MSKRKGKNRNEKQRMDLTAKDVSTNQGKRRESETSFGPAEEVQHKLPQGSSPNPEQKHKPTFKSIKHKAAKVFGLAKSSSTSQPLAEDPSLIEDEENTVTQVEDLSSSPKSIKKPTGASNTVGLVSEPLLTLAQDSQSPQDFGDVVKQKSEAPNLRSEPSPLSITHPLCSSSPSSSSEFNTPGTACLEEHQTAGRSEFCSDVESTGEELCTTNVKGKDSGAQKTLTKKLAENQKLKEQNKALEENLKATETACKKFQEELEQIKEQEQKDQFKLHTEVTTLRAKLEHIENEKQSLACELATKKEKLVEVEGEQTHALRKAVKAQEDLIKDKDKSHADEMTKISEELQTVKQELTEVTTLRAELERIEREKQSLACELAKNKKKLVEVESEQTHALRKAVKAQEDLIKARKTFEDKDKSHADQITKISDELQRVKQELTGATCEHQDAIRGFETQKTAEILELKQQLAEDFQNEMREKEKEIKAQLAISHQNEIEEVREQLQKKTKEELKEGDSDEETHCTENLRAQLPAKFNDQFQDRVTAEVEKILAQEKETLSQKWMKKNDDLRTHVKQIEADYNQQLAKSAQEYQEEMKKAKQLQAEYELKIQLKSKALEEAQEQLASTKEENQHKFEALNQNITALRDQNTKLNMELLGREEQSFAAKREYKELEEKYQQLEIQAMAKQQLSGGTQSEGDTNEMLFPSTCTAAELISSTQGPPQVEVHSSLVAVANHLSKFVDSETVIHCAKERTLDRTAMLNAAKALGLSDQSKPLSYVFVVLPANQHNSSIVLDYTPSLQQEQVVDHPLQDRDTQQIDSDDDEYHSSNEETEKDNRTDAQKLQESRRETENLRESNKTLSMELEELRKDLGEQIDKHRSEVLKHEATKKELTEKVQEKVRELRLQRSNGSTALMQPPTSECASSSEDIPSDDDPIAQVRELKVALRKSNERIESLQQHVKSFENIETQNQQLQQNSKLQSTTVFNLKRKLEAVEAEVKLAKKKDEEVLLVRQELAKLQEEKNTFEDEKTCWEREMSADKDSIQDLKKQLADSRVNVSSLEASLKLVPGQVVGEGVMEQEIKLLKTEVTLLKIENEDNTRNLKISQKSLAEIERQRLSLERKLNKVAEERDNAQSGMNQLQVSNRMAKAQLNDVGKKLDVTLEHAESLSKTVEEQTTRADGLNEENVALKNKIQELEDELSAVKFQAQQYEEDFAQERRDRESAIGAKDNQFGKFHAKQQQLVVQLAEALSVAENEKKERLSLNKKLEVSAAEIERLTRQINQSERDFTNALQAKSEEMGRLKVEKAQIMGQMEHFRAESSKLKQRSERADVVYQQRENEYLQQTEHLKVQLEDKTQVFHVQSVSFEEQIKQVTDQLKEKEKELEILAAEKQALEERLMRELSQAKNNSERLAKDINESRGTLETALADTARLHDDVLAKTAQVKQYKKQTDSFKLKVEEANEKLLKTQKELQRCQELIKTMEEDQKDQTEQARLTAESEKLTAETNLVQAKRRIDALERQVYDLTSEGGQGSEALRVEIERKREIEQKLECVQIKYQELIDKCDSRYQAMVKLQELLTQHGIALPKLEIDKAVTPVFGQPGMERRVSPHQTPYSQNRRDQYDQPQQGGQYDHGPTSPILSNQDFQQQRQIPPAQLREINPMRSLQKVSTAPHSRTPQGGLAGSPFPHNRMAEDGGTYSNDGQQRAQSQFGQGMPPLSRPQAQPCPQQLDTSPPLRAKDPDYANVDDHFHGKAPKAQDPDYANVDDYYLGDQQKQQWGNQQNQSDPRSQQNQHYPRTGQGYTPGGALRHNQGQQQYPPGNLEFQAPHQHGQYQQQREHAQRNYPQNHPQGNQYQAQRNYSQNPGQERFQPNQGYPIGQRPVLHQEGAGSNQVPYSPTTSAPAFGTNLPPPQSSQAQGGPQPPTPTPRKSSNNSSPSQNSSRVPITKRPKQDSGVQENALLEGIDRDIKEAAYYVIQEGEVLESMAPEAPFDPNLICPLCMRNFRVGEIQKYKKHVNSCQGQI